MEDEVMVKLPARYLIENLVKEYLNDSEYTKGFISQKWVDRVIHELELKDLDDWNLANMWDMVWLTIENLINQKQEYSEQWRKLLDAQSAFTEVVNAEARRRKG